MLHRSSPLLAPEEEGMDFGADLTVKPQLKFSTFHGPISLQAAVSPDSSYELVKAALETAKSGSEVLFYIYNVSAPHLLKLLGDAKKRGAKVKVMYDITDPNDSAEEKNLKDLGVELKVAPSRDPRFVFSVCHQKFVVIDGKTLVLGSANWAGTSIPERLPGKPYKKGNREWLVRVDDKRVAGWFRNLFKKDWDIPEQPGAAFEIVVAEAVPVAFAPAAGAPPKEFALKSFFTEVKALTPIVSPDNYYSLTLKLLEQARKRILIEQQYVVGGNNDSPSVNRLLETARARKDAGVDVRFIVSSKFDTGWTKSVKALKGAGMLDRLKAINLGYFVHCHNKGVIADDKVIVTSTNWSENSISRAREAGVLIDSKQIADYYADVFDFDWESGWDPDQVEAAPFALPEAGEEMLRIHYADAIEV